MRYVPCYDKRELLPLIKNWLLQDEARRLIEDLKIELSRGPIRLAKLGTMDFAVQYRNYMATVKHRKTLPGEIKIVLKEIPGVSITGPAQGEVCGLCEVTGEQVPKCQSTDRFQGVQSQMLEWLSMPEEVSHIGEFKETVNEEPMTLVEVGNTDFAVAYKSYIREKYLRNTMPGEIKALLKLIPELSIRGTPPREVCGLVRRQDDSYWADSNKCDSADGSPVRTKRRGGLRSEGWIADYDLLMGNLKRLAGIQYVDMVRLNATVDQQKSSDLIYRYFDNKSATPRTADMKIFDTGLKFADTGKKIMARFLRTTYNGWHGIDLVPPEQVPLKRSEITNAESLFCQAYMPDGWLTDLKSMVQAEKWTINKLYPDSVLMQYLKLTYFKLRQQGEIWEIPGVCQIFNTGLVDGSYDNVLAYMIPNEGGIQPWRLKCFGVPMKGPNGRLISENLGRDLKKARWFERVEELSFDTRIEVIPNYWHCMVENATRLPRSLIKKVISDDAEREKTVRFLDEIEAAVRDNRTTDKIVSAYMDVSELESDGVDLNDIQELVGAYFKRLPDCGNVERKLKGELDMAIRLAKKIVDSDYTAAVPMYYPVKRKLGLLLPLAFDDPRSVDCALVVEKNRGGRYEGSTILTCEMAYADARLLRRPDAQWILDRLPIKTDPLD